MKLAGTMKLHLTHSSFYAPKFNYSFHFFPNKFLLLLYLSMIDLKDKYTLYIILLKSFIFIQIKMKGLSLF